MALILTATLISGPILWGLGMAFTGVLLGLAGMDVASGALRFTFGIPDMADGMDFVVVAMGLFAFAEIISQLGERETQDIQTIRIRSEEHTSELQSLMRISYAVFCLVKKIKLKHHE